MTEEAKTGPAMPSLEDWQHWTLVMGRAQQMLMQAWADGLDSKGKSQPFAGFGAIPGMASPSAFGFSMPGGEGAATDPMALMTAGAQAWAQGLEAWGKMLGVDPASKAEAKRYAELKLLQKAGVIRALVLQPRYTLHAHGCTAIGTCDAPIAVTR